MEMEKVIRKMKERLKNDIDMRDIEEIFGLSVSEEVINFSINDVLNVDIKDETLEGNVGDYFSSSLVGVKLERFQQALVLSIKFDVDSESTGEMLLTVANITKWNEDAVPCMSRLIAEYLCEQYEVEFEDELQLAILNNDNDIDDLQESFLYKSTEYLNIDNSQSYNYNKDDEFVKCMAKSKNISYGMAKVFIDVINTVCDKYGLDSTPYLDILKDTSVDFTAEYIYSSIFRNF